MNPTTSTYIGIDIGGTSAKIGLIRSDGTIVHKTLIPLTYQKDTSIMPQLIQGLQTFISTNHIAGFLGIGVSATGAIDVEDGCVIGTAGHLAGYLHTPIKQDLEKAFKTNVTVINDANAAAFGELFCGNAKGKQNVVVVTIGTGIGGGIIIQGQLLLGHRGLAGEIGHTILHQQGMRCTCGNHGCWEAYGSMHALCMRVLCQCHKALDGYTIFESQDPTIVAIRDSWLDDNADGIVSLIHIFNPELVLIGGGISNNTDTFLKPLIQRVYQRIMPHFKTALEIDRCALKNDAGMIGAVYYFIQSTMS